MPNVSQPSRWFFGNPSGLRYSSDQCDDLGNGLTSQGPYEEVTCQAGTDKSLAFEDSSYRGQELMSGIRFYDEARSPGAQGFFRDIRGAVLADEQNLGIWRNLTDSSSGNNSIEAGQAYVQKNHVGL